MLGLRFLWGNPGRTQGQSLPPDRGQTGAAGRGEGPWGHQLRQPHPSPHDLLQDPEPAPTSPSRRSPQSPSTGWGCMSAGSQSPEPPNGGQGWRVIGRGSARRGGGPWRRTRVVTFCDPHNLLPDGYWNTPTSGSAARNTFTFCCTKCFFLVLEAKPKPGPGAAVAADTVAGGTEEDAIVSLSGGCTRLSGKPEPAAKQAPDPGSGAHLGRRHVTGGCPAGAQQGGAGLAPPPGASPAPTSARWVGSPGAGGGRSEAVFPAGGGLSARPGPASEAMGTRPGQA